MATKTKVGDTKEPKITASGLKVKLDRLFALDHRPLAVFSVSDGRFAVHGIEVVNSRKGPFVQMPQTSYKRQGETVYKDIFHPITAEARQELYSAVMDQYEQARVEKSQQQENDEPAEDENPGLEPSM